jgi:uncharacterized SAM-binding protein YcdF (DUF218 family)
MKRKIWPARDCHDFAVKQRHMFAIKKLLSALLQPCSVLLALIGVGLLLLRFTKKHRMGKILLLVGLGGWFLSSISPVANALVRPLEKAYPLLLPKASEPSTTLSDGSIAPRWIVVLGGGNMEVPAFASIQQLSSSSVARLTEGIRLQRLLPESRLLLSGGTVHSRLLADSAASLGVPRERVTLNADVLDTADEVQALRANLGAERFVLVTSAMHMPRAMALCRKAGMNPIAAPTDYAGDYEPWSSRQLPDLVSSARAELHIERALHEYLGLAWSKLRGQI